MRLRSLLISEVFVSSGTSDVMASSWSEALGSGFTGGPWSRSKETESRFHWTLKSSLRLVCSDFIHNYRILLFLFRFFYFVMLSKGDLNKVCPHMKLHDAFQFFNRDGLCWLNVRLLPVVWLLMCWKHHIKLKKILKCWLEVWFLLFKVFNFNCFNELKQRNSFNISGFFLLFHVIKITVGVKQLKYSLWTCVTTEKWEN